MSTAVLALTGGLGMATALAAGAAAGASRRAAVARRLAVAGPTGASRPAALLAALPAPPAWLEARARAAALPVEPTLTWACWLLGVPLVAVVAAAVGGPGLATLAAGAAAVLPAVALGAAGGRHDRLLEAALPEALEAVARALRSGASLRQAVVEASTSTPGPLGAALADVGVDVDAGTPLAAALDGWERRHPLPGVRLAVAALGLGAETGGAHARAVDGVAATLRSRLAVAGEVRALSSQARLSGLVIVLAPLGFSALASATDERTAEFLLRTPAGWACLGGGLALDVLAAVWMHRLSRVDV